MSVRDVGEDGALQAMSRSILVFEPKIADRYALEEQKEKVHGTEDHDDC
jgi:hypothetical protein